MNDYSEIATPKTKMGKSKSSEYRHMKKIDKCVEHHDTDNMSEKYINRKYNKNRNRFVSNPVLANDWRKRFEAYENKLWKDYKKDKDRICNLATNAIDRKFSIRDLATNRKAECMTHEEYFDNEGKIQVSNAKLKKWGNTNAKINVGLTRNELEVWTEKQIDFCRILAEWHNVNKKTRVRRADEAVEMYFYVHFNCRRAWGHSLLHYSQFTSDDITYATIEESNFWGIDIDEPVITINMDVLTGYKSDDARFKNWPKVVGSVSVGGVWVFLWKDGKLSHSRFSFVATLISGEGCHSEVVREESLRQMSQLTDLKYIKTWSKEHCCWICVTHVNDCGFDWPFETAISGLLGHSSDQPFHGITQFIEGEPVAIPLDDKFLDELFIADIPVSNYDIDFNEWTQKKKSGIVLTTPEIYDYFADIAENEFDRKLGAAKTQKAKSKFDDKTYCQRLRCDIAWNESTYVNNKRLFNWQYNVGTDPFHAFGVFQNTYIRCSILEAVCVNRYQREQITGIFGTMS